MNTEKVIIIGSGPAGHTAAIYAARASLEPLMFEGYLAGGVAAGGQLTTTTEVENFPWFEHIQGTELMQKMRNQSLHCGARIITKTVQSVDLSSRPFKVVVGHDTYLAESLIIATGATAKRMNVPGEEIYWQKGVSACAVCDGGLPVFRGKHLAVIGWGDTALEEALYLTKFASKVSIIVRRDVLRASKAMQTRAMTNPKIEFIWNTTLEEIAGNDMLISQLKLKNLITGESFTLEVWGLFYAIGHVPNTTFLDGQLKLDEAGYIITQPGSSYTSVEGVFAAGDVQDHIYRQAITSAGSGCMAALDCERWLAEKE